MSRAVRASADRLPGRAGVAAGDELGPPDGDLVGVPHHVDPLGVAQGVVLAGGAAGHDAAHPGVEAALDDGGEGGGIDLPVGVERRDHRDVDAFELQIHGRTLPRTPRSRSPGRGASSQRP